VNPLFFGDSARQLFGAYDAPRGKGRRGVVLCHPTSSGEYQLAHPTVRVLARRLADDGWHALRFDYFGTGDSAGDLAEATQDRWLADIETAVDELKEISQVPRVSLVGMRHGATLAAMVAGRRPDVDHLVLWDPVFDGREYLAELERVCRASSGVDGNQTVSDVDPWRRDIAALTPSRFGPRLPKTLIVNTQEGAMAFEPLAAHLATRGVDCQQVHVPDVQVWREEWRPEGARMAVGAVNRIAAWMS